MNRPTATLSAAFRRSSSCASASASRTSPTCPERLPSRSSTSSCPGCTTWSEGRSRIVGPETTVYMLDCASLARGGCQLFGEGITLVTIDHHQDNPGNADLNLLDPDAASTTAILYDDRSGGTLPHRRADRRVSLRGPGDRHRALPVREHERSGPQDGGGATGSRASMWPPSPSRCTRASRRPSCVLLGIALERMEIESRAALMVTSWLREEDFAAAGADDSHAEGIIDTLRQVQGATWRRAGPGEDQRTDECGDEGESPLHGRQGGRGRDRSDQRVAADTSRPPASRPGAMSTRSCSGQSGSFRASCDRCGPARSCPGHPARQARRPHQLRHGAGRPPRDARARGPCRHARPVSRPAFC